jgi:undecaprenyl-diphosphatase
VWLAHWSGLGMAALLLGLAVRRRGWQDALVALAASVLAQWLARQLAVEWDAPRPFMLDLSPNFLGHGARGGFPSTHATVMFAVCGVLWRLEGIRRLQLAALAIAILTAWARVHAGAHFPLDVLAGAALGTGIGTATMLAWRVIHPSRQRHHAVMEAAQHSAN